MTSSRIGGDLGRIATRVTASSRGGARRLALEALLRVVLVALGLKLLPHIFWNDVHFLWRRTRVLSRHHLPYRNFVWEYPPLSLVPILLVAVTRQRVEAFSMGFGMVMAGCELATLELLRRHLPVRRSVTAYWYAVAVPLCAIGYYRLDWPATLFATWALLAIVAGRSGAGQLVAGFAAKLWPAVTAAVLAAERRYRDLALSAAGIVAVVAAWYAFSPSGFRTFLRFRRGSGFQVEGVVGAVRLLAGAKPSVVSNTWVVDVGRWRSLDPAMTVAWLALLVVVVFLVRNRAFDPFVLTGGLVVSLMLSNRLLSPQFMVWPVPFVAAAWAGGDRVSGWLFGLASAVTLAYLCWYTEMLHGNRLLAVAVVVRNLLLVVVAARLLARALAGRRDEAPARRRSRVGQAGEPDAVAA